MASSNTRLLLAAALALAACTATSPGVSANPPVSCPEAGCVVVGVAFSEPQSLDAVQTGAESAGGDVVALWRTDSVCVPAVGSPPVVDDPDAVEPSRFAYANADIIREIQNQGPPATDGGWSQAIRDRFVIEWEAARLPGVTFDGAALLVGSGDVDVTGTSRQVLLDSYLTDETNVLYLRGHEDAFAALFLVPTDSCAG